LLLNAGSNKTAFTLHLDGEIVCLDAEGRSIFNDLLRRRGQPVFCAFDLTWLNGADLRVRRKAQERDVRATPRLYLVQDKKSQLLSGLEGRHEMLETFAGRTTVAPG